MWNVRMFSQLNTMVTTPETYPIRQFGFGIKHLPGLTLRKPLSLPRVPLQYTKGRSPTLIATAKILFRKYVKRHLILQVFNSCSFTQNYGSYSEATTTTTTSIKYFSISKCIQCSIRPPDHLLRVDGGDTEIWHWRPWWGCSLFQLSVLHNSQIPHACVEETFWRRFWNSFCTGIFSHPNGSGDAPWGWIGRRRPCCSVGRKRVSRLGREEGTKRNRSAFRRYEQTQPARREANTGRWVQPRPFPNVKLIGTGYECGLFFSSRPRPYQRGYTTWVNSERTGGS